MSNLSALRHSSTASLGLKIQDSYLNYFKRNDWFHDSRQEHTSLGKSGRNQVLPDILKAKGVWHKATRVSNILLQVSKVFKSVLSYRAGQWRDLSNMICYHPPPRGFGRERLARQSSPHIFLCREPFEKKILIRSWFIFQTVLPWRVPWASKAPKVTPTHSLACLARSALPYPLTLFLSKAMCTH